MSILCSNKYFIWGRESPLDYKKAAHASLVGCNNLDFLFHCWPFLIRLSISNTYTYILRRFIPTPIVIIIRNIKKTSLGTTTIFRSSISILIFAPKKLHNVWSNIIFILNGKVSKLYMYTLLLYF